MTATTSRAPGVTAWRNAVFAIFGITGLTFASWASRIPQVRDALHADDQQIGLLLLGVSAGAIVGLLFSSHIVARLGATNTIRLAFSIAPLGLVWVGVLIAVAPSFAVLIVGLAVYGAGQSIVDVAMNLSGAANERVLGRTVMPLYHAAFSLGTVLGAGAGSALIALRVSITAQLVGTGVLAIAVTLIATRFLQPAEAPAATDQQHDGWRERIGIWRNPRVLVIGLVVLGAAFAEGGGNDWLSLAMVDGHGLTPAGGAAVFAVFVAAMTVGRIAGVALLDRFGRVPVLRGSGAVAVAGLLLVVFGGSAPLAVAGAVLWGLGAALGFPVGMSAAADDPRTANAAVSAAATMGYCAFLVGPPLIGFLAQQIGVLHGLLAVLVLIALGAAVAGGTRQPRRDA